MHGILLLPSLKKQGELIQGPITYILIIYSSLKNTGKLMFGTLKLNLFKDLLVNTIILRIFSYTHTHKYAGDLMIDD